MEVIREALEEFPKCFQEIELNKIEQQIIMEGRGFEESIIHPYLWEYMKKKGEKRKSFYVVFEYKYGGRE
ncbi:MAG: hypothetical protein Q9N34_09005 [Aquificota bacterium]|nr:hypothetical protein [Aquificota bacterium]